MYRNNKRRRYADRIVRIHQQNVCPIVRDKASRRVGFGFTLKISIVGEVTMRNNSVWLGYPSWKCAVQGIYILHFLQLQGGIWRWFKYVFTGILTMMPTKTVRGTSTPLGLKFFWEILFIHPCPEYFSYTILRPGRQTAVRGAQEQVPSWNHSRRWVSKLETWG